MKTLTKEELRNHLDSLIDDLGFKDPKFNEKMRLLSSIEDEKNNVLMSLYTQEYGPCSATSIKDLPRGKSDYTAIMIDFSNGFDNYKKDLKRSLQHIKYRNQNALILLLMILNLSHPYSEILYYRFYKQMSNVEVMHKLYLSKATYFRKYKVGFTQLLERLNNYIVEYNSKINQSNGDL